MKGYQMDTEELIKLLKGHKIQDVLYDDEEDLVVLVTERRGTTLEIAVFCDPEGNHPGSLHIEGEEGFLGTLGWR